MRRRLAPGGLVAINYTSLPNGKDAQAVARTLKAAFPHVRAFTDGSQASDLASVVFMASASPILLDPAAAAGLPGVELFLAHEARFADAGGRLLTDDYNPLNIYRVGATRLWRQRMIRHIGEDWAYWADF